MPNILVLANIHNLFTALTRTTSNRRSAKYFGEAKSDRRVGRQPPRAGQSFRCHREGCRFKVFSLGTASAMSKGRAFVDSLGKKQLSISLKRFPID
jgi:hypothetical protein